MSSILRHLKQALAVGLLRNVDYYFARHIHALDGTDNENLALLAGLTSASLGEGNVCLDLAAIADTALKGPDDGANIVMLAALDELLQALQRSAMVGKPGEQAPLIVDASQRLYLGRYWWYEKKVAETLRQRAQPDASDSQDLQRLGASLKRLFPIKTGRVDWQMVAAAITALRRFSVISGGPGTGKTHTVTAILALLIEQNDGGKGLNIALAAPTGKAAARLSESIRKAKPVILCADNIRQQIPEDATTIHRLIGIRPGQSRARYHADNSLPVDVLVVDEASMIDLPLMAALLEAVPPNARIIMLGDKDQLASVEAGSVFADISGGDAVSRFSGEFLDQLRELTGQDLKLQQAKAGFSDCVVQLQTSYRFGDDSGIGGLARAINDGDVSSTMALLYDDEVVDVSAVEPSANDLAGYIDSQVIPLYAACIESATVHQAISRFNEFRLLCALRKTATGVEQVNALIEARLRRRGLIDSYRTHYAGRPILITRNDHGLGLFNGDTGILWPDPDANGELRAWFVMPDNTTRRVLPARLPEHETAYAMTIHKSQGSEFERVLIMLPYESSPVLTRELLYTGITRARRSVEIWAAQHIITQCVHNKVERASGLADHIYE
jgi:exodeoxyribonuclease V alpha subunit